MVQGRLFIIACMALLLTAPAAIVPTIGQTAGSSSISDMSLITADGRIAQGVVAGQKISLKLTLNSNESQGYVTLLDLRDKDGFSLSLQWQSGNVIATVPSAVGFSWTPEESGEFLARTFVLSSLESPEILSGVSEFKIKVVDDPGELPPPEVVPPVDIEEIPDAPAGPGAYTVLVYIVASDLENSGYYATEDIREMMAVGSTPNVNVVIQTGGSANSTIDEKRFIDFTKVQRHLVLKDRTELIQDLGERNMGSSTTLKQFVGWGIKEYPADKYVMVLWDHGAGILGFGFDDIHLDVLDLDELREGLEPARLAGKKSR